MVTMKVTLLHRSPWPACWPPSAGATDQEALFKVRAVHLGAVLDLRTSASQKCEVVPRRARTPDSLTFVSIDSKLESNKAEENMHVRRRIAP